MLEFFTYRVFSMIKIYLPKIIIFFFQARDFKTLIIKIISRLKGKVPKLRSGLNFDSMPSGIKRNKAKVD